MSAPVKQCTFAGGEITPAAFARSDLALYEKSARTLRNMICMKHGGASGRPGTEFVGSTLNGGNPVRLIPFIFNETGIGQSYMLEFGNKYIAFYQNGAVVISAPNTPYKIVSPYLQADLSTLKFSQSADIISITHQNYVPGEVRRYGAIDWQWVPCVFLPGVDSPTSVTVTGGNSSLTKQFYAVTCISSISGEEGFYTFGISATGAADSSHPVTVSIGIKISNISQFRIYKSLGQTADTFGYVGSVASPEFTDYGVTPDFTNSPPLSFNPFSDTNAPIISNFFNSSGQFYPTGKITYIWAITTITGSGETLPTYIYTSGPAPSGGSQYHFEWPVGGIGFGDFNIYRNAGDGSFIFGRIKTNWPGTAFTDDGSSATNFAINPPSRASLNNPGSVGFTQQRRAFANTKSNPVGFWESQTGLYSNFSTHVSPADSDAIIGSLAGEEVNEIQHIVELKFQLILSAGAEVYIQGNGTGVVTPSSVNASTQSQFGCSQLKPIKAADVLIFSQSVGAFLRDFAFDFSIDGYRGNDISIFASHLFEGYQIVDMAYQKIPDSIVWVARSDGVLLSCTYVREQQVLAWTHHDLTNGFVENVCAIPENGNYSVYVCIRRTINGSTVRYIERLSQRIWQGPTAAVSVGTANAVGDPINAPFCDCSLQYDGRNTSAITMTLTVSGSFLPNTDNTAYQQQLTLTASAPYFGSGQTAQVGDQIFFQDSLYVSSKGADGNQTMCTIQSISSSTIVIVTPDGAVPSVFQAVAVTIWARAVKSVSGLTHLIGQQVSIWADRFVVGSPLNSHYSTVYTVASDGTLTLDKPYSVIYVGLPMIQDIETLDLETYFGETMLGRRKRTAGLYGYLYNTRSFYAGTERPEGNAQNTTGDPLFQLFPLRTGIGQDSYDEPPPLITGQEYLITMARWSKSGSIFMRNVDPLPWTLLAVSPKEEDPVQGTYKRV